jgi:sugar phosphate isomerase/epimerase
MRLGVLSRGFEEMEQLKRLGFHSMQWMRFAETRAAPQHEIWKPFAEEFAADAQAHDLRISCIGADYRNPLDPAQTDATRELFRRAILVAEHIKVKTVSGFPGAVIETEINERGGNPVYKPFENYLDRVLAFWEPLAQFAADHGVRIAFEHCPQGPWHLPVMHYNILGQPAMWERLFNATACENIGLEWDASHLVCQFIDPVANIHRFGKRIFHVHAKDAFINRPLLEQYGICHPGVAEHRFPGLGQSNWAEIIHALVRAGYDSDINIEGWHDPVYRGSLEEAGLIIARKTLEPYIIDTERP